MVPQPHSREIGVGTWVALAGLFAGMGALTWTLVDFSTTPLSLRVLYLFVSIACITRSSWYLLRLRRRGPLA